MFAVLISTWWVDGMRVTLQAGIPWLVLITVAYYTVGRRRELAAQARIAARNAETSRAGKL